MCVCVPPSSMSVSRPLGMDPRPSPMKPHTQTHTSSHTETHSLTHSMQLCVCVRCVAPSPPSCVCVPLALWGWCVSVPGGRPPCDDDAPGTGTSEVGGLSLPHHTITPHRIHTSVCVCVCVYGLLWEGRDSAPRAVHPSVNLLSRVVAHPHTQRERDTLTWRVHTRASLLQVEKATHSSSTEEGMEGTCNAGPQ